MFTLDNSFVRHHHFTAAIIGCGGTGGFAAEGLCRILPPNGYLVLVDHDRVEETNLGRQNFTREELGRFKSEALAKRLAARYARPIAYSVLPVPVVDFQSELIIGCVDNGLARKAIAEMVRQTPFSPWWVDAGNGQNYGQVLIGRKSREGPPFIHEVVFSLPLPTSQMPELLLQAPRRRSCAEAVAVNDQGPVINQAMAALVVEVVRRLIEGTCPWMQLYLDLEAGTLTPVMATPENVKKVSGKKNRSR